MNTYALTRREAHSRTRALLDEVALRFGEGFTDVLSDSPSTAMDTDGWISAMVEITFPFPIPGGSGIGRCALRGSVDLYLLRAQPVVTVAFGDVAKDDARTPHPFDTVDDLVQLIERAALEALQRPLRALRTSTSKIDLGFRPLPSGVHVDREVSARCVGFTT